MNKQTTYKVFIVVVLLITFNSLIAQEPETVWDYPIKPGSLEWKSTPNFVDRLNLLNIPTDKLESIGTDQLVRTCLDYPYFGLIFTRNSLQQGYDFIRSNFNGFRELEDRPDAVQCILKEYSKMNPTGFKPESSPAKVGEYMAQFTFIELLLAQYQILNNIDNATRKQLVENALDIYKGKAEIDSYGIIGLSTTAFVMGRATYGIDNTFSNLKYEDKNDIEALLKDCSPQRFDLLDIIVKENESYIRKK